MTSVPESSYQPPENLKARLAESYNKIAPEYNEWTVPHNNIRLLWLQKLLGKLPTPTEGTLRILELGAGAGLPTGQALLDHDPKVHYIANDLSSHQLELLQQNLSDNKDRITVMEGDMLVLDIPASSLAGVIGMYSIIHLPRQEQSQLLLQISKWLAPGGVFLASFAEKAEQEITHDAWLADGGWMYWSGWGVDGTVKMVEDAGLEILEKEVVEDAADANFLWLLAVKKPLAAK